MSIKINLKIFTQNPSFVYETDLETFPLQNTYKKY